MRKGYFLIFCLFFISCYTFKVKLTPDEHTTIWELVKLLREQEFVTAKFYDGSILKLRDSKRKDIGVLNIPEEILKMKYFKKIMYIRKNENRLYFILNGWGGDESGILYAPGNISMSGIMVLQKIEGTLFYFKTNF
jgi:hypothetical protein